MTQFSDLERENRALRKRLSRLSAASLRINESLEFDTVLQEVLDSARLLSGASYGVITLFSDSGAVAAFLASGMTPEEAEGMWAMADGPPSIKGSTSTLLNDPGGLDPAEMRQFFLIIDDQANGDRTANFPVGRFPVAEAGRTGAMSSRPGVVRRMRI